MGATSVLGTGPGSAEGACKGAPERQTLGVGHLIGPHIVFAGSKALSSGAASVSFPVTGSASDYILLVSNQTDGTAVNGTLAVSSGICTLTLAGSGADVVGFAVVKVSNFGL